MRGVLILSRLLAVALRTAVAGMALVATMAGRARMPVVVVVLIAA